MLCAERKTRSQASNQPRREKCCNRRVGRDYTEIALVMREQTAPPPPTPTLSLLNRTGNKNSILSDECASFDLAFRPLTISLASSSSTSQAGTGTVEITVDFYCGLKSKDALKERWQTVSQSVEVGGLTLLRAGVSSSPMIVVKCLNAAQNARVQLASSNLAAQLLAVAHSSL